MEEGKFLLDGKRTMGELLGALKKISTKAETFSENEIDTFIFCFLLIGYIEKGMEKSTKEILLLTQRPEIQKPELIDLIIKEKTFSQKIDLAEFLMKDANIFTQWDDWIDFCRRVNQGIRNNLFHFKLDKLQYRGMDVLKIETKNKMLIDLVNAEKKAGKDDTKIKQ